MSVLMCDIRGFSRISERYAPRQVIEFLIAFLTPMSAVLLASKATLDKYIGDAILAFWNAPLDDPDHPENAARAALAMIEELRSLNSAMTQQDKIPWPGEVQIGIGLNTGLCCVGNMGSRERLSYTLIGDTVNVASRLEGLTKVYGVSIIVGDALAARLPNFALVEIDRVRVVGRNAPMAIFALLGDERTRQDENFRTFFASYAAMLAAYRARDWANAVAMLKDASPQFTSLRIAGLATLFAERIAGLAAHPPGSDWDGTYEATQK